MPFLPAGSYRKTRGIIRFDTRANQPAATAVLPGTLYFVTDGSEGSLEYSNGTTWEVIRIRVLNGPTILGASGTVRQLGPAETTKAMYVIGDPVINNGSSLQFYSDTHPSFPGHVYIVSGGANASPNSIIECAYRDSGGYHPLVTISKDGAVNVRQTLLFTGKITPAQITADQNDYAPTGHATASVLRLSSDALRNITGLAGGVDGRLVQIHNVGSNQIDLKGEDAGSTAANRFSGTAATYAIQAGRFGLLTYDGTASRWRVIV